jgi:mono/diheme cytochrome c family protein
MKQHRLIIRYSFSLALLLATCSILSACGGGNAQPGQETKASAAKARAALPEADGNELGMAVYKKTCKLCHGLDGKLGGSGAANLSISLLSEEEAISVIQKGRGLMQAYEDLLTEEEIKAVASYIQKFKD